MSDVTARDWLGCIAKTLLVLLLVVVIGFGLIAGMCALSMRR